MIVVTGASGYIGGQIVLQLLDAGHRVLGIDTATLHSSVTHENFEFFRGDFALDAALGTIAQRNPTAIIHCAGTSLVGPSMQNPQLYYHNNVAKTLKLLDFVVENMPRTRVIFSSSAATYGEPVMVPCHEVDPCEPISPYGESKLMIERIMRDYNRAYGLDYVAFRFFNACGADPEARHGQAPGATHIIARVLESLRDSQEFTLYGNNYPTPDGTCVRDYVHVSDIAQAHIAALSSEVPAGVYNLGSNAGTSNQEIIAAAERITGQQLRVVQGEQRAGDPPMLTASDAKFSKVAKDWRKYTLDDMIQHAWNWYVR
jgi:UDP-glucose 4-epimerase